MAKYVILGCGAFGRETYWHILDTMGDETEIVFADDSFEASQVVFQGWKKVPVMKDWCLPLGFRDAADFMGFVVGVGGISSKEALVHAARMAGIPAAPTVVHPRALVQGKDCVIGRGGIIGPGCVLTTNVKVGDYVVLNLNCTVGHDSIVEDYVTCNPGSQISGNVSIGKGCFLGSGAVILESRILVERVTVGAQACVVKDILEVGVTVAGVPARPLIR